MLDNFYVSLTNSCGLLLSFCVFLKPILLFAKTLSISYAYPYRLLTSCCSSFLDAFVIALAIDANLLCEYVRLVTNFAFRFKNSCVSRANSSEPCRLLSRHLMNLLLFALAIAVL